MYRFICNTLIAILFVAVGSLTTAYGQMSSDSILKVNIPNSFEVGNKAFPAGVYLIKPTDQGADSDCVLEIQNARTDQAAFFDTFTISANTPVKSSKLDFDKVGDTYFLRKIWVGGETGGNEIAVTRQEKKMEPASMTARHKVKTVEAETGAAGLAG